MFTTDVVDLAMKMVPGLMKIREWKMLMGRRLAEAPRLNTEIADIKQSIDALVAPLREQVNEFLREISLNDTLISKGCLRTDRRYVSNEVLLCLYILACTY